MAAKYPYYLMADTPEGQRREAELTGAPPIGSTEGDIRKGFIYERVPHVTLKSIAQNPEIEFAVASRSRTGSCDLAARRPNAGTCRATRRRLSVMRDPRQPQ
jgi:hypothetical protein